MEVVDDDDRSEAPIGERPGRILLQIGLDDLEAAPILRRHSVA